MRTPPLVPPQPLLWTLFSLASLLKLSLGYLMLCLVCVHARGSAAGACAERAVPARVRLGSLWR